MSQVETANETPYTSITIQGLQFEVAQPFKAGHVLTEGEASQLNQVRAENVRNNFAGTIRKAIEEHRKANTLPDDAEVPVSDLDKDELDEKLSKYDDEYVMGVRGGPSGPRTPVDPIQREANRIALEKVKTAVKKKGITLESVPKEKMASFVKQVLEKYPEIIEEAKRRVSAASQIALESLEV